MDPATGQPIGGPAGGPPPPGAGAPPAEGGVLSAILYIFVPFAAIAGIFGIMLMNRKKSGETSAE